MPFEVKTYLSSLARRLHLDPAEKDEIIEELEGHLEDKTAELVAQGVDHDTAATRAIEDMGAPNAVARGLASGPDDDDAWVEEIPYDQTRGYVKRVLRSVHAYRVLY